MNTYELSRMADDLADLATKNFDDETISDRLIKCSHVLEDIHAELRQKTREGVGDAVQAACHQKGVVGPMSFHVIRGRASV